MKEIVQSIFAAIGGTLAWFFGGIDALFYALVAFSTADYISGVAQAIINKRLNSAVGFRGIARKVLVLLIVGIAAVIDRAVLGSSGVLRSAVICYYIANEGISLIENATKCGLPIPEKLRGVFEQLFDKGGKE